MVEKAWKDESGVEEEMKHQVSDDDDNGLVEHQVRLDTTTDNMKHQVSDDGEEMNDGGVMKVDDAENGPVKLREVLLDDTNCGLMKHQALLDTDNIEMKHQVSLDDNGGLVKHLDDTNCGLMKHQVFDDSVRYRQRRNTYCIPVDGGGFGQCCLCSFLFCFQ